LHDQKISYNFAKNFITMGLKGSFHRKNSTKLFGIPIMAFVIENTNFLQSETFDLSISDGFGRNTWFWRNQVLKRGEYMEFSLDTVNKEICQGDIVCLLGANDKVLQRWQLQLPEYAPGECPECHGTHKCSACNGNGYDFKTLQQCKRCGATGVCPTCYIPQRGPQF
jgi:hypothetical protein